MCGYKDTHIYSLDIQFRNEEQQNKYKTCIHHVATIVPLMIKQIQTS